MPADSSRYCIVEANNGPVRIEVSVDKALIAGGELRLIDEAKQFTIERTKITVDDTDVQRIIIGKKAEDLHKQYLIWQFLVCSMIPTIYSGKVYVKIFQGSTECHTTIPATMTLSNIPPCRLKAQEKVSGSLSFVVKKSNFRF